MRDRTVSEVLESIRHRVDQVAVIVVAFTLLVLLLPVARELLERLSGLDTATIVAAMVGLSIPLIFGAIRDLGRDIRLITARASTGRIPPIEGGVGEIYPHVHDLLVSATKSQDSGRLRVIGLTLYTAWPHIHNWIDAGLLDGWEIHLTSLSPDVIRAEGDVFDGDWADESRVQARKIEGARVSCEEQGCKLTFAHYELVPAFHGFEIGEKAIVISFTSWSNGLLAQPHGFYELIRQEDDPDRFRLYRSLFDQWFGRLTTPVDQ